MLPVLFRAWGFTLHTYGLLVAIGFLVGIYVAERMARRFDLEPERIFNLAVYLAIGAIVGAKLFLLLQDWRYYLKYPRALLAADFWESGGIFYGGVIVALLVLTWYVRRHRMRWLAVGDAVAPGVAIGHSIGRLGCFAAGCCWGKPTALFFGVTFTSLYANRTTGVPLNVALYPTQLIESAAEFVIFLLLLRLAKRRAFVGELTAFYLVSYGVVRYLVDFIRRIDPDAMLFHGLMSAGQLTSLCMIVLAIGIWARQRHRPTARPAPPAPAKTAQTA